MKPAKRDIDPDAKSHAGKYGDFQVSWFDQGWNGKGWYIVVDNIDPAGHGPFHTSQAAFGAAKDAIDQLLGEGK